MTVCAVKSCKNYTAIKKKSTNISFHTFPADPVIFSRWIEVIRQSRGECWWKPKNTTPICSDHFRAEDIYTTDKGIRRIRPGAVPTKALYISSDNDKSDDNRSVDIKIEQQQVTEQKPYENCQPTLHVSSLTSANDESDDNRSPVIKMEQQNDTEYKPYEDSQPALHILSTMSADEENDDNRYVAIKIEQQNVSEHKPYENCQPIMHNILSSMSPNDKSDGIRSTNVKMEQENVIEYKPYENCQPGTATENVPIINEPVTISQKDSEICSSDSDSLFDTPKEAKFRKDLRRICKLRTKHQKQINSLQQKIRRLEKKNASLEQVVVLLKRDKALGMRCICSKDI